MSTGTLRIRRRGLLDVLGMLVLVHAVYARTPIGALAETFVRAALGQRDRPSLFATFRGLETTAPARAAALVAIAAPAPNELKRATILAGVDEDAVAALFAAHGSCAGGACSLPAPPYLYETGGGRAGEPTSAADLARALAVLTARLGSPEPAIEALYIGRDAVGRAIAEAHAAGRSHPERSDVHAAFLPPPVRRGSLPPAILALALYRVRTLAWPVDDRFPVTSPFGPRVHPVTGRQQLHAGTDIGVPPETTVRSAQHGDVRRAGRDSISGNFLVVDHGFGIESVYCHLSAHILDQGETSRLEPIARSGATGRATGPHLHFGLRIDGQLVDPERHRRAPEEARR